MEIIITLLVNAIAFYAAASLLKGVSIRSFGQAIVLAIIIAILNVTLGFLLKAVTLGILSLGIFTLLLDAILIKVADYFLKGFEVRNFWWALLLAVVTAVIHSVIGWVF
ncbi:MAG: putative membrane protein [Saprospiraceae bacterium]|jgi:putative membrane protein